ncbi:MAG: protocatechuate 3,4-dioxygenase [Verrucomicrobiales bacterium]|nr:protocatechuate 3,4-dioxygenase [Verrucomicrobiales bacterium]
MKNTPSPCPICHRRSFLVKAALGSATFLTTKGAFAEALLQTPFQTEGPFYPDKLPLDTDNDLLVINNSITPSVGDVTHLTGTVRDIKGKPVRNAVVEAWEADANGCYIHTGGGGNSDKRDKNFQGFGRFLTDSKGRYYFRTIKPVAYGPRAPHIHMAVIQGDKRMLTTQCYIKGHPLNEKDGPLSILKTKAERDAVIIPFKPVKNSKTGELQARFDIVIGTTPEDRDQDSGRRLRGNAGRPQ